MSINGFETITLSTAEFASENPENEELQRAYAELSGKEWVAGFSSQLPMGLRWINLLRNARDVTRPDSPERRDFVNGFTEGLAKNDTIIFTIGASSDSRTSGVVAVARGRLNKPRNLFKKEYVYLPDILSQRENTFAAEAALITAVGALSTERSERIVVDSLICNSDHQDMLRDMGFVALKRNQEWNTPVLHRATAGTTYLVRQFARPI
ncbi:MAG: hypothetical protein M3Q70_01490 [bacterium]|nr:hypothetical protein [bacterium]